MRRVAAVPLLLAAAIILFFGYAAFDAVGGTVDFDGTWPSWTPIVPGLIFDAIGIAILLKALHVLRAATTGRWSIVFLAMAALSTLPFANVFDSRWGLLVTGALVAGALVALVRASAVRPARRRSPPRQMRRRHAAPPHR